MYKPRAIYSTVPRYSTVRKAQSKTEKMQAKQNTQSTVWLDEMHKRRDLEQYRNPKFNSQKAEVCVSGEMYLLAAAVVLVRHLGGVTCACEFCMEKMHGHVSINAFLCCTVSLFWVCLLGIRSSCGALLEGLLSI